MTVVVALGKGLVVRTTTVSWVILERRARLVRIVVTQVRLLNVLMLLSPLGLLVAWLKFMIKFKITVVLIYIYSFFDNIFSLLLFESLKSTFYDVMLTLSF